MKVEGSNITINDSVYNKMSIIPKGACEQDSLPSEYQAVEYIESSGTQYIDTNYVPNQNTKVSVDFQNLVSNENFTILGVRNTSNAPRKGIMVGVGVSYTKFVSMFGDVSENIQLSDNNLNKNNVEVSKNGYYFNGNLITTPSQDNWTINQAILLFAMRQGEGQYVEVTLFSKIKMYSCKIWESNILVRNFIPCYRKSDNVIGMYDLVNSVFYINQGTGIFTKGNNVNIPNPNQEIPIRVVNGDNSVVVQNENLFDDTFLSSHYTKDENGYYTDGILSFNNYFNNNLPNIKFKENTQYTFQWYGYNDSGGNSRIEFHYTDGTKSEGALITVTTAESAELKSLTSTANKTIDYMNFTFGSSGERTLHVKDLMLKEGSTVASFIAHKEQSITLHLGDIKLNGIGDYIDLPFKDEDTWKIRRYIGKVVFDGSEDENWQLSSTGASRFYLNINDLPLFKMKTSTIGIAPLCNYFIGKDNNSDFENGKILLFKSEQQSYFIRLENDNISTLEDFKTWLSTHNLILYYILNTPIEETITDTTLINDLNALQDMLSYNGVTIITVTSEDTNAQMTAEVTYTSESDMCEKLLFIFNKMKDKLYHIIRSL